MSSHSEQAKELFKQGYNCSQAVFAAFCDETGMDFETALKIASSFGGGMGRLREVCGAVSGAFMVLGMKYGSTDPSDKTSKKRHYKLIQDFAKDFENENGSIICRELLALPVKREDYVPEDRTIQYYKKRPCLELVADAAKKLDEYMQKSNALPE